MKYSLPILFAIAATAALAHGGVTNPAVMARMNGMSASAQNLKLLGTMAKGQVAFDVTKARAAAMAIADHSQASVALFTEHETDAKSEARASIWDNFDDFSTKALALEALADDLAGSIRTLEDVQAAMVPIGDACTACHTLYRE